MILFIIPTFDVHKECQKSTRENSPHSSCSLEVEHNNENDNTGGIDVMNCVAAIGAEVQ